MGALARWFKKPRSKKRWALYGIGAFIALLIVIGLAVPAEEETSAPAETAPAETAPATQTATRTSGTSTTSSESASTTTAPAPEPSNADKLRQAFEDTDLPLGEGLTFEGLSDGFVTVKFEVADNFTDGAIRNGIAQDTFAILEAARDSGARWKLIDIEGTFPLVDEFGNESQGKVYEAVFNHKTADRINYDNIDVGSLDNVERLTVTGLIQLHPDIRD